MALIDSYSHAEIIEADAQQLVQLQHDESSECGGGGAALLDAEASPSITGADPPAEGSISTRVYADADGGGDVQQSERHDPAAEPDLRQQQHVANIVAAAPTPTADTDAFSLHGAAPGLQKQQQKTTDSGYQLDAERRILVRGRGELRSAAVRRCGASREMFVPLGGWVGVRQRQHWCVYE